MEWVETTGRTLEEAQDAALDELGVDELDAEFEVLEEPKLGLFGRVRSEARVRARVRPNRPAAREDRRPRRRRPADAEPASPAVAPQPTPARSEPGNPQRSKATGATSPRRQGKGRQGRDPQGGQMDKEVPMAEQGDAAREFLDGLVGAIGGAASIEVRDIDEQTIEVAVVGDGLGLLIGPAGATLAAVQDLTRTAVQRRTGGRNGRIMVDVGGYREKRRSALERFTRQIATQVLDTGQPKVLEPMQAADRKVVHDTVNTIDGVATVSEGEEPRRRVIIQPL